MADLMDNKNNQNHVVGVDDGTECIELVNRHGETIGKFTFRPTDTGIVDRYEKIKKDLRCTFVTTYGVKRNPNSDIVANEVVLDDLFK